VAVQGAQFFRIAGPVPTAITSVTPDGTITWTNAPTNATFTVQTATLLSPPINWVDYVQVPASNAVTVQRIFDPNPPPGMDLIPAGSFTMGNCMDPTEGATDELPLHTVYVSAFYMDQYLVTSNLWLAVKAWNGGNGYSYDNAGSGKASTHPVQRVNWYDTVKWCNARSQKERLTPCYYADAGLTVAYKTGQVTNPYVNWSANGYRLPTEAEWEKAARGGASGHRFPWTDTDTITWSRANYQSYWYGGMPRYPYDVNPTSGFNPAWTGGGSPYTSPVGSFAANGYGLYDMAGNVREWCWDLYSSSYYSSPPPWTDPHGPAHPDPLGSLRLLRGGGYQYYAFDARCACRYYDWQNFFDMTVGFRCVRGL
jgi:formylglycine-generating enzyme